MEQFNFNSVEKEIIRANEIVGRMATTFCNLSDQVGGLASTDESLALEDDLTAVFNAFEDVLDKLYYAAQAVELAKAADSV